mmetsp:Transcript_10759/g.66396  ORF Transcript_10759/g.66396 Transcript_10759/m.66396 type:complete len:110 (+) Transcript_10759:3785-4114(+)
MLVHTPFLSNDFVRIGTSTCNVNKLSDLGIENWTPSTNGRVVCELQVQGNSYLTTRLRGGRLGVLVTFRPGIQLASILLSLLSHSRALCLAVLVPKPCTLSCFVHRAGR